MRLLKWEKEYVLTEKSTQKTSLTSHNHTINQNYCQKKKMWNPQTLCAQHNWGNKFETNPPLLTMLSICFKVQHLSLSNVFYIYCNFLGLVRCFESLKEHFLNLKFHFVTTIS